MAGGTAQRKRSSIVEPAQKYGHVFADLKRILRLDWLRLRDERRRDEFDLAAIAQNLESWPSLSRAAPDARRGGLVFILSVTLHHTARSAGPFFNEIRQQETSVRKSK